MRKSPFIKIPPKSFYLPFQMTELDILVIKWFVDIWVIFPRTHESSHFDIGWKRYDGNSDCCAETFRTWSWIFFPRISSILSFFYSTSLITLNGPKAFDWSSLLQNLWLGLVMFLFYFIVFKVVLENVFVRGKVVLENVQINKIGVKNKTKPSLYFLKYHQNQAKPRS